MIEKRNNYLLTIIGFIILIIGALIIAYPGISNYFIQKNASEIILNYSDKLNIINDNIKEEYLEEAKLYNENLVGKEIYDPFVKGSGYTVPENYNEVLNINQDGILGYIEIPKINLQLPIYHGTDSELMEKGICHIENTSFPIEGQNVHSILVGHRGLPRAELFSRLNELKIEDYFYINTVGKKQEYRVFNIEVIEPEQLSQIITKTDGNTVTLVTCTPYGINTHRLLVQGTWVDYIVDDEKKNYIENEGENLNYSVEYNFFTIIPVFIFIFLILIIIKKFLKRNNEK